MPLKGSTEHVIVLHNVATLHAVCKNIMEFSIYHYACVAKQIYCSCILYLAPLLDVLFLWHPVHSAMSVGVACGTLCLSHGLIFEKMNDRACIILKRKCLPAAG